MERLEGEIRPLVLPHLFLRLRAEKCTGIAVFESEGVTKKVYIKNGDLLFASSTLESDRLGDYLLSQGKITKEQYDASVLAMKKDGIKQGAALVQLGFITPQMLVQGVRDQVASIVYSIFTWRGGRYCFDECAIPSEDIIPLRMGLGDLILNGVRRLDWQMVQDFLPHQNTVLRPSSDPLAMFKNADLSPNQKEVLFLIDGRRTIREVCSLSRAGDFYTLKVIFLFLALRMVEAGGAATKNEKVFASEPAKEPVSATVKSECSVVSGPSELKDRLMNALNEMQSQDHHEVLGITRAASPQEIQAAYLRLARLYHPDRYPGPEMQDMKPVLERLLSRVTEAYNALKEHTQRSEYSYLTNMGRVKTSSRKTGRDEAEPEEERPAEAFFKKGMEAYNIGSYWPAIESFKKACSFEPSNAVYLYYLGLSFTKVPGKYYEAEESLRKAAGLDPMNEDYAIELSNLYVKRGLKPRAAQVLDEARRRVPESERLRAALEGLARGQAAASGKRG